MSDADAKLERRGLQQVDPTKVGPPVAKVSKPRVAIVPLVITLAMTALAIVMGALMWDAYLAAPWTRDATVRTYVVTIAPEVAGRIVQLPVKDNQFVHKGDLLLVIDPTDYKNAVQTAEANVEQARANALNAQLELQRRPEAERARRDG
jgi:multidrug resistance efflux pump